jgi:hypothetical protein
VLYQTYAKKNTLTYFFLVELSAVQRQLTLSLELLGAREEEIDDLRLTMEEQRGVFQAQVEALLAK